MSGSQANSIEQQLAERRRRMQQSADSSHRPTENQNQNQNQAEPMDLDGPFSEDRHQLEQEIVSLSSREREIQNELASAQNNLLTHRARMNILRQADARPPSSSHHSEPPRSDERMMTQEEKDHEIAMMLQRQFERDEAQSARREEPQPSAPPASSGFSFSFSRSGGDGAPSTFSYSSSGDGGGVHNDEVLQHQRRLLEMMGGFGGGGGLGLGLRDRDPFADPFGRRGFGDDMMDPFGGMFGMPGSGMGLRSGRRLSGGPIGFPPMMFGPVGPFGIGGMNVDLDNMDHEQILRLQEMIGHVPRGATVQQLSELPTSEYQAAPEAHAEESPVDANDERRKCSICLEQFETGDAIKTLPCFHIFHADEVDKWLQQNSVCPICREPIQSRDAADVPDAPPS